MLMFLPGMCVYISPFFFFPCLFTYKHFACFLREFPCKVQLFLRLRTCPVHNLLALQRAPAEANPRTTGLALVFDFAYYCSAPRCDGPDLSCGCREQDVPLMSRCPVEDPCIGFLFRSSGKQLSARPGYTLVVIIWERIYCFWMPKKKKSKN